MPPTSYPPTGGLPETPLSIANGGTDATSAAAARTALGLGSAATHASGDFDSSGAAAAAQAAAIAASNQRASNLSDVANAATARSNLGALGSGSDVVGATQLAPGAQRLVAFQGRNGAGACTSALLKAGDKVINILNVAAAPVDATADFEATITVNGQIQQTSSANYSLAFFLALVVAKGG